ncbi:MAG: hypothetical protein JKY80_07035 [Mariprofundaceae bacterium]|nr:hypothetical protein [Mariprofundaceae bacterium]
MSNISIKEPKQTVKGKTYTGVGIRVGEQWYQGVFWGHDNKELEVIRKWNVGIQVNIAFYVEYYKGKAQDKWRFPTEVDLMEERITRLETAVKTLWEWKEKQQANTTA